jgi:tetratricopeptide (TPR) repeat protein
MRGAMLAAAGAVVAIALGAGTPVAGRTGDEKGPDCDLVEAFVDARRLVDALEELGDGTCPSIDTSAIEDQLGEAAGLLARAQRSADNKDFTNATLLSLQVLEIDAGSAQAVTLLASIAKESSAEADPLIVIQKLRDAGYPEKADELVVELIKADPTVDVSHVDARSTKNWYARQSTLVQTAIVAAVAAVLVILGRVVAAKRGRRRLQFVEGTGTDAAALCALTRVRLRQLGQHHSVPLQVAGAPEEINLPTFADADTRLKPLDFVVKAIFTPRPRQIVLGIGGGAVAPKVRHATIELKGRSIAKSVSWRVLDDDDDARELQAAAAYAAGWSLLAVRDRGDADVAQAHRERLPTNDPYSYGPTLAGNSSMANGDLATAKRYFADALVADPGNYAARSNLAFVLGTSASMVDIHDALEMLDVLIGIRSSGASSAKPDDSNNDRTSQADEPSSTDNTTNVTNTSSATSIGMIPAGSIDRARANFNRASLTANYLAAARTAPTAAPGAPTKEAEALTLRRLELALCSLDEVFDFVLRKEQNDASRKYAGIVLEPTVVLAAGLVLEADLHKPPARPSAAAGVLTRAQAALSRAEVRRPSPTGSEPTTVEVAVQIIELVSKTGSVSPKTNYNLACSFTRLGRWDDAFRHLNRANQLSPGVMSQAKIDPVLKPLRAMPRWKELAG